MISAIANRLVGFYVRRFSTELNLIRNNSDMLQKRQLKGILSSPYVLHFFPEFEEKEPKESLEYFKKFGIQNYAQYVDEVKKLMVGSPPFRVKYFAQSSGTLGKKKLIPTPDSYIKMNHYKGSWYVLFTLLQSTFKLSIFGGKTFLVGGSIYSKTSNYLIGDISGIMLYRIPWFLRPFYVPKKSLSIESSWKKKLVLSANAGAHEKQVRLIGGIPTWVLTILRNILEMQDEKDFTTIWPSLGAYIHGGINFRPYKKQFENLFPKKNLLFLEVYNATEGFFAFQDDLQTNGLLLLTNNGIYFEFIEYKEFLKGKINFLALSETRCDLDYVMIISTWSGFLRYNIGDVVRIVSQKPYRIRVVGRVEEYINAFGEDLLISQANKALILTLEKFGAIVRDYTVAPKYLTVRNKGYHQWYIEFEKKPENLPNFALELDRKLRVLNTNYDQKRISDLAVDTLRVRSLPHGTFYEYHKRTNTLSAQCKMKKLSNERKILDEIDKILNGKVH